MSNNQKQRSATDRLNDVEQATMSIFQALDNMTRDLMLVKDAIKLLGNKLDSVVKVVASGGTLTDETISAVMVENNIAELKSKVDDLIARGVLVSELEVQPESFVVIREVDETGKVVNPRLQFTMAALPKETVDKLLGAQPGQVLQIKEGTLSVEILETYTIVTPQAPQAAAPQAVQAPEAAPAPAETPAANS